MPIESGWGTSTGITFKAWRYACKIPSRLESVYGYPRGHKLYIECTRWKQVKDVPKGWIFL